MATLNIDRRDFLKTTAGCAACVLGVPPMLAAWAAQTSGIVSPGCRKSKVRVAKLYLGRIGAIS